MAQRRDIKKDLSVKVMVKVEVSRQKRKREMEQAANYTFLAGVAEVQFYMQKTLHLFRWEGTRGRIDE